MPTRPLKLSGLSLGQNSGVPTHVALLRGINLGGRNRVAMADLRTVVTSLGHTDVATYIQSGNVVFTSTQTDTAAIATALEHAIAESVMFLHTSDGLGRSELAAQLSRASGPLAASGSATMRNWATVTKLLAMCEV